MRKDLTHITFVVDRSGSMDDIRTDAEGGINTFIKHQKELPGHATLTMVQFDHDYEFVHRNLSIAAVPNFKLVPRGSTALLDAVGRAIVQTGDDLRAIPEKDRPGLVVFVIVTDGYENSSKEFKKPKIREMIKHQTEIYSWQFQYLAANQDAFAEGDSIGVPLSNISSFQTTCSPQAYASASANIGRMRSASSAGLPVVNAYTPAELQSMQGDEDAAKKVAQTIQDQIAKTPA